MLLGGQLTLDLLIPTHHTSHTTVGRDTPCRDGMVVSSRENLLSLVPRTEELKGSRCAQECGGG